jgi:sulfur carrier protein
VGRGRFVFWATGGPVQITVNGKVMEVADGLNIEGLLATLGVKREFTAVAVNREIARRHEFESIRLKDGDRVEVVRPMGGGAR